MTPEQIAAARERCQKSTRGEWEFYADHPDKVWGPDGDQICRTEGNVAYGTDAADDATFIAHAHQDLPAALDALDYANERSEQSHRGYMDALNDNGQLKDKLHEATEALADECTDNARLGESLVQVMQERNELRAAIEAKCLRCWKPVNDTCDSDCPLYPHRKEA